MASHGRFSPLRSPRRILTALAVAVLLGGTAVGVVGMAAADDAEGLFALPPRHAGDEVQYAADDQVDPDEAALYRQLPMRAWKDADGRWHATDVLVWVAGSFAVFDEEREIAVPSLVDVQTYEILAAAYGTGAGMSWSQGPLGTSESESRESHRLTLGATWHPCGFANSLQDAPAGSKTVQTTGWCGEEAGPATFKFEKPTTYKDARAMVYAGPGGVRLTFAEGIPYPVHISTDEGGAELVGFHRGSEPLQVPDVSTQVTPLPVVAQGEVGRLGPDMAGLAADYPLQAAFEEARDDPAFSDLRDYIAGNPDWYLLDGQYEEETDRQMWWLEFTAPAQGLSLLVVREPSSLAATSPVPVPEDLAWDISYYANGRDGGRGLPFDEIPQQMPLPADVGAAWQAHSETDDAPPVVGFTLPRCNSGHCTGPDVYAGLVGTSSFSRSGGDPLDALLAAPADESREGTTLQYDGNGTLTSIWLVEERYQSSGGVLTSPQPSGQDAGNSDPPASTAGIGWAPPPGETAAGITLVSLLVALGYYLWPLAKGLPLVGLWSRRRGGTDVLDHPMRRSLYDHIKSDPGVHYQQLVRQVGRGQGVVEHHLRRLQDGGLVSTVRRDGYVCHFPAGRIDRRAMAAAPALRSDGARAILAAVQAAPGASVKDVAQATGLSPGTVTYHLRRLRETGAIESDRNGRTVRLHAADWMT